MTYAPIVHGTPTVEIERKRYDKLIAAEERLNILEKAIKNLNVYNADFEIFKRMFDLDEKNEVIPEDSIRTYPVKNEGTAPEGENA